MNVIGYNDSRYHSAKKAFRQCRLIQNKMDNQFIDETISCKRVKSENVLAPFLWHQNDEIPILSANSPSPFRPAN